MDIETLEYLRQKIQGYARASASAAAAFPDESLYSIRREAYRELAAEILEMILAEQAT